MILKKKREENKISAMIIKYAGNFILDGEDEFEKQQRLNTAASAWNFACLSESERKRAIKKTLKECKKLNPGYNKKNLADIRSVLNDLIANKNRIYPEMKVHILDAQLKEEGGKVYVTVASVDAG